MARCYSIIYPCSDGVGRTGTFITIHAQMERMKSEAVVDMFQYIKAIRIQRAGMVSNKVINAACFSLYDVHYIFISQQDQYEFCHQVLADFLDAFDTYANFK